MNSKLLNPISVVISFKLFVFIFALIWFTGIIIPIFLETKQIDLYYFLKMFYSPVCHQNPDKSFIINNIQVLVCSRCFGIYLGLIIASILSIFKFSKKIKLKFLVISSLIIIFDIISYQLGIYSFNKIISMITGVIFGVVLFLFIFELIIESILKEKK